LRKKRFFITFFCGYGQDFGFNGKFARALLTKYHIAGDFATIYDKFIEKIF